MTDTTDLLDGGPVTTPAEQDEPAVQETGPRTRRRASTGNGLAALVLPELKALAADLGIGGVTGMRKSQLIEVIQAHQAGAPAVAPAANGRGAVSPAPATGSVAAARTATEPTATRAATEPAADEPARTARTRGPRRATSTGVSAAADPAASAPSSFDE